MKRRFETVMVYPTYVLKTDPKTGRWKRHFLRFTIACAVLIISLTGSTTLLAAGWQEADERGISLGQAPQGFTNPQDLENQPQRLIIQTLQKSDLQTPASIVNAAAALLNVNLEQDVRFLLNRLGQLNLDDDQALALVEETGSEFFRDAYLRPGVQPEGRQVAGQILAAADRASKNPARIQKLIQTLSSNDISAKRLASQRLELLREAAVAELLNVFADDQRSDEYAAVRQQLKRTSKIAMAPVVGAAWSTDPQVKLEAIRTLARIDDEEASEVLMWAFLAPHHSEPIRELAGQALAQRGIITDPTVVENRFFRRAFEHVKGNVNAPLAGLDHVNFWHWDEGSDRLVPALVAPETFVRITAARLAASLYEINPDSSRNRAIYLLTQLERAKRLATQRHTIDVEEVVSGLKTNAPEVNTILSQAVRLKLFPAATACCEILQELGESSLLYRYDGQPSALIEALTSGDRYLQVAAFETIAKLNPQKPFVGSSYMMSMAAFLAQSRSVPVAIVGHPSPDVAQSMAASIATPGIAGQPVTSGRDLFDLASSNPDIEVILISDRIPAPGYRNLIKQLRNDYRTRRLPIALLYTEAERGVEISELMDEDPLFIAVPWTDNAELIANNIDRLVHRIRPYRVSPISRRQHATEAVDWLSKIASDREKYRFYELASHQDAIKSLMFVPGFEGPASDILASLGTPAAQRQLISYASQAGIPIENREKAAEAFARAVQNRGTMLTAEEIRRQYRRYQASAQEPTESQAVLGKILDTIEARASR